MIREAVGPPRESREERYYYCRRNMWPTDSPVAGLSKPGGGSFVVSS
jgi:hypothetical protein